MINRRGHQQEMKAKMLEQRIVEGQEECGSAEKKQMETETSGNTWSQLWKRKLISLSCALMGLRGNGKIKSIPFPRLARDE